MSTSSRRFGVEVEFVGGAESVIEQMRSRAIPCSYAGYTHRVMRAWKLVTDSSVREGHNGLELVSPVLRGERGRERLADALEALRETGPRVDKRCGLHVHHDVRDLSVHELARLATNWAATQPAVDRLVAPSRRSDGNMWCEALTPHEIRHITSLTAVNQYHEHIRTGGRYHPLRDLERYRSLNFVAYPRQGTVEVRQHQGTTNTRKIAAWVEFGQAYIAVARRDLFRECVLASPSHEELIVDLVERGGLADETGVYLLHRAAAFDLPASTPAPVRPEPVESRRPLPYPSVQDFPRPGAYTITLSVRPGDLVEPVVDDWTRMMQQCADVRIR